MRRRRPDTSEPLRSCIGCRTRRPQSALVRITRSARGITIDGASDGRGAWLCRNDTPDAVVVEECLHAAIAKRAFGRAWRGDVTAEELRTITEQSRSSTGRRDHRDGDANN